MADLEGGTPAVEGVEPTQLEGTEPTTPKVEPTVSITETPEFRRELDRALGKGLASTQSQLSLAQAEARKAQAEVEMHKSQIAARDAQLQGLKREVEEALVDDPEKRQAYISRIAGLEREQKIAEREAKAEERYLAAEKLAIEVVMNRRIDELVSETGISRSELLGCATEAEAEVKALRFKMTKEPEAKESEKSPKFDSIVSSGGGMSDEAFITKLGSGELSLDKSTMERAKKLGIIR